LKQFLSNFDDCFARSEPRVSNETIIPVRLSGLERKNLDTITMSRRKK